MRRESLYKRMNKIPFNSTNQTNYEKQRKKVNNLIGNQKKKYFSEKLQGIGNNTKKLWSIINHNGQ